MAAREQNITARIFTVQFNSLSTTSDGVCHQALFHSQHASFLSPLCCKLGRGLETRLICQYSLTSAHKGGS